MGKLYYIYYNFRIYLEPLSILLNQSITINKHCSLVQLFYNLEYNTQLKIVMKFNVIDRSKTLLILFSLLN